MSVETVSVAEPRVDDAVFRNVVGHFASGVAVVTTAVDGELYGTTVSAVSSLSMDPPMMLVCLNRTSNTHDQVKLSGRFAINVLSSEQADLAYRFAKKAGEKFAGLDIEMQHGVPTIPGALARIVCATDEEAVGGTHTVFLGRVLDASAAEAQPLAYYRGKFGSFHSGVEEQAYLDVRRWVLEHRELRSAHVPINQLVDELAVPRELVGRAIAKLAVDRLITIEPDDSIVLLPITVELMTSCINARAAIECGVLTTHMEALRDDVFEDISRYFDQMQALRDTPGAMPEFLGLNARLQNRITGLGGSEELVRAFNRLGIGAVWTAAVPADSWADFFDASSQEALIEALRTRDVAAACAAVQGHADRTIALVHKLLAANGGAV